MSVAMKAGGLGLGSDTDDGDEWDAPYMFV